jgi:CO dehydrogenase nickel-insertion accessory protein CooC1
MLNELLNDKYLTYYYSDIEKQNYYNEWLNKSIDSRDSYTFEQYKLYEQITIENSHIDMIQLDHYFDEGCTCKACSIKRFETTIKILKGIDVKERIVHIDAKTELLQKRVVIANNINNMISKLPLKTRGKDFKKDMTTIVFKKK